MAAVSATDVLRSGLNLMRRLPPRDVNRNLSGLTVLQPGLTEEFLQRVDQPLQTRVDAAAKRRYILCDYNRDGDSYRSPWSNSYDPPVPAEEGGGFLPSSALRALEVQANELFDSYRELYYDAANSVSSVYFWETDGDGFAGCWLVKKEIGAGRYVKSGCWDSIHVIEASPGPAEAGAGKWQYKLTTSVLLTMAVDHPESTGSVDLAGSLTRQAVNVLPLTAEKGHVANMGGLIEAMEGDMRTNLDALYIAKTREIVAQLRSKGRAAAGGVSVAAPAGPSSARTFVGDLAAAMAHKHSSSS